MSEDSNSSGKTYSIKIPNEALSTHLINDTEQVASFARQKNESEEEREPKTSE